MSGKGYVLFFCFVRNGSVHIWCKMAIHFNKIHPTIFQAVNDEPSLLFSICYQKPKVPSIARPIHNAAGNRTNARSNGIGMINAVSPLTGGVASFWIVHVPDACYTIHNQHREKNIFPSAYVNMHVP